LIAPLAFFHSKKFSNEFKYQILTFLPLLNQWDFCRRHSSACMWSSGPVTRVAPINTKSTRMTRKAEYEMNSASQQNTILIVVDDFLRNQKEWDFPDLNRGGGKTIFYSLSERCEKPFPLTKLLLLYLTR